MDIDEISKNSHKSERAPQMVDGGDIEDLLFLNQNLSSLNTSPTKECVIFLIDCSTLMNTLFEEEKTTSLTTILKVTENFLKTKIISKEKDSFGIVFFNSLMGFNNMNLDEVNNILHVHPPNALTIKKNKRNIFKM